MIIKKIEKNRRISKKNNQKINDSKKHKQNNNAFDKKSNNDCFNVVIEFNKNVKKKQNKKTKK